MTCTKKRKRLSWNIPRKYQANPLESVLAYAIRQDFKLGLVLHISNWVKAWFLLGIGFYYFYFVQGGLNPTFHTILFSLPYKKGKVFVLEYWHFYWMVFLLWSGWRTTFSIFDEKNYCARIQQVFQWKGSIWRLVNLLIPAYGRYSTLLIKSTRFLKCFR